MGRGQNQSEANAFLREPVISSYSVPINEHGEEIKITRTGKGNTDVWAIRLAEGLCLSRTGKWVHEPFPSSRTDSWLKRHRWSLEEAQVEAVKQAEKRDKQQRERMASTAS